MTIPPSEIQPRNYQVSKEVVHKLLFTDVIVMQI